MTHSNWTPEDNSRDQSPTDEEIGSLLEAAGSRSEIPPEDLLQIVTAAESTWQATVQRQRFAGRRKALAYRWGVGIAATLAAALALVYFQRSTPQAPGTAEGVEVARIERALGGSSLSGQGSSIPLPLAAGGVVQAGSVLQTDPLSGSLPGGAALRLASGASLRMDAGTRVRLLAADRIHLEVGAVYFDSGSPGHGANSNISIETAFGVVTDIGTQFSARVHGETLRVLVREGMAQVDLVADGRTDVTAGEGVEVSAEGGTTRFPVAPYGADWTWVLDCSPGFRVESPSVSEYLGWLERETGLEVEVTLEAAEALGHHVFGGAMDLTPDRAQAVLLTVGLSGEIRDGVLWVEKRD